MEEYVTSDHDLDRVLSWLTRHFRSTPSAEDLNRLLGTLPQELNDDIFDRVFTAGPGTRTVDKNYKTPAVLQVSRATRKKISKSYYDGEGVIFLQPGSPSMIDGCDLSSWVEVNVEWVRGRASDRRHKSVLMHTATHPSQVCAVVMEMIHVKMSREGVKGTLTMEDMRAAWRGIVFYFEDEKKWKDLTTVGRYGSVMLRIVVDG